MSYELRSARYLAADALRQIIRPGDTVIDATLGNGHDTCMLAELVGELTERAVRGSRERRRA